MDAICLALRNTVSFSPILLFLMFAPFLQLGRPALAADVDNQHLKIVFIDVGQGDSTLLILPSGKSMLIDGGEVDKGRTVLSMLEQMHVKRLDAIVATHPHADHIGGLISIMSDVPVGRVIDSGQDYSTNTYLNYLDAIDKNKIPFGSVHDGDKIDLDPLVNIRVLNPPNPLIRGSDDDISNNSVVLKITYGNFTAVFPGDVKEAGESRLAAKNVDASVLLAAHHGSSHANSIPFLRAVSPETVVIYAGTDNQYGFPSKKALDNFEAVKVKYIFRTDLDGSVMLTADRNGHYDMQTLKSERSVTVPEFDNPVALSSLAIAAVIALKGKMMIWRKLR